MPDDQPKSPWIDKPQKLIALIAIAVSLFSVASGAMVSFFMTKYRVNVTENSITRLEKKFDELDNKVDKMWTTVLEWKGSQDVISADIFRLKKDVDSNSDEIKDLRKRGQ